jgi:hypothetical protein
MSTPVNRRIFGGALLAGTGALAVQRMRSAGQVSDRRKLRSRVAILNETSYFVMGHDLSPLHSHDILRCVRHIPL